jgi:hypothetical protein
MRLLHVRRHMLASYVQTHGYKQGLYIDPETMEVLLNNEAVREVLELLKVRAMQARSSMHEDEHVLTHLHTIIQDAYRQLVLMSRHELMAVTNYFATQGFYNMSPPDDSEARGCPIYPYRFGQGQCMTTLFLSTGFKVHSLLQFLTFVCIHA